MSNIEQLTIIFVLFFFYLGTIYSIKKTIYKINHNILPNIESVLKTYYKYVYFPKNQNRNMFINEVYKRYELVMEEKDNIKVSWFTYIPLLNILQLSYLVMIVKELTKIEELIIIERNM